MTNMTLSMPEELLKKMRIFREIKWSEVARQAIEKRIAELEMIEKIVSKSKLTKKDVKNIAELVDSAVAKKISIK